MAISISVLGLILSTHLSSYLPINFYSFPAFLLVNVQSFIKKKTNNNKPIKIGIFILLKSYVFGINFSSNNCRLQACQWICVPVSDIISQLMDLGSFSDGCFALGMVIILCFSIKLLIFKPWKNSRDALQCASNSLEIQENKY